MARSRVVHFIEAQILERVGVGYIDESEALALADEENFINKHNFSHGRWFRLTGNGRTDGRSGGSGSFNTWRLGFLYFETWRMKGKVKKQNGRFTVLVKY
ncbi:hypothetical protein V6N13_096183 [Hibiscus sabdariffa]|uniref:PdxS/SNZ N-terminal domain-containing protein n=1 Tax=Hibiscus sabdariffa TaxID=183260 RepID=A0ABR2DGF6_9ROSI